MKIYFGNDAIGSIPLIEALWKLRQDFGVCTSVTYLKKGWNNQDLLTPTVRLRDSGIPFILDNGAFQTFNKVRQNNVTALDLRDFYKLLKPDWMIAPDVMYDPVESKRSMIEFIETNNDLELMAPLHSINFGSLEAIESEINELKDAGYKKFGLAKPYLVKSMSRSESFSTFTPIIRKRVNYLHYLAFPITRFGGDYKRYISLMDSADLGLQVFPTALGFDVYKYADLAAQIISSLLDISNVLSKVPHDNTLNPSSDVRSVFNRSIASIYK